MSYTIQQVARRAGVQLNALSEAECSDEDLLTFASHLGESWTLIGQSLKLTKEQLSAIEGTIAEKRLAVLQQWKESTLDATYQVLAEAFLTCKMPRSALKLCEHFKESHPTGWSKSALNTLLPHLPITDKIHNACLVTSASFMICRCQVLH